MKSAQQQTLNPYTVGFTLAASLSILFNLILVIIKETYPAVLDYMKSLLGHHWITHGVAVVLVFLLFGFIFSKAEDTHKISGMTLTVMLTVSVLLGGFGLLVFFLLK